MILKSPSSRLSLVNLFADFILNQIPKEEESIIQVVDCFNFYVIKGKTTYNKVLDIGKLKDEFIVKFSDLVGEIKLTHTVDLIEYDSKLKPYNSLTFAYHNNDNCSYLPDQTNSFNIPSSYPVSTLTFELSNKKDSFGEQMFLVKNKAQEIDEVLTSAILDVFDFEMSWLESEMKKVDWFIEITNPLKDYDFLKKKIKDFIIF